MKRLLVILACLLLCGCGKKKNEIEWVGVLEQVISDPVSVVYMHIENGETTNVQSSDPEVIDACIERLQHLDIGTLCEVSPQEYSDIFILISRNGDDEAFEFENGKYIHNGRRYETVGLEKVIAVFEEMDAR